VVNAMKWFQQNRWLGTFLISSEYVYYLRVSLLLDKGKWSDARQRSTRPRERSRLQRLDPFPNEANYRKLKVILENYSAALDKLKEDLKKELFLRRPSRERISIAFASGGDRHRKQSAREQRQLQTNLSSGSMNLPPPCRRQPFRRCSDRSFPKYRCS